MCKGNSFDLYYKMYLLVYNMRCLYLVFFVLIYVVPGFAVDIQAISARDCERFRDYENRLKIVEDSMAVLDMEAKEIFAKTGYSMGISEEGEGLSFEEYYNNKNVNSDNLNYQEAKKELLKTTKQECLRAYKTIKGILKSITSLDSVGYQSPYSTDDEIDLKVLLNVDSRSLEEIDRRIQIIENRIAQTEQEREKVLRNFLESYPSFEYSNGVAFDTARIMQEKIRWQAKGDSLYRDLVHRCDFYKKKLVKGVQELEAKFGTSRQEHFWTYASNAVVNLKEYDSEKEAFNFCVYDTVNTETPFLYQGMLYIPIDDARQINREKVKFDVRVEFYNDPLETERGRIYPGMINIDITHAIYDVKIQGAFVNLDFSSVKGYKSWKNRILRYKEKANSQVDNSKKKSTKPQKTKGNTERKENNTRNNLQMHKVAIVPNVPVILKDYNPAIGAYRFSVQDSLNKKTPFAYEGLLYVPADIVGQIDPKTLKFGVSVEYFNDPLETKDGKIYPGMISLKLFNSKYNFKHEGYFVDLDFSDVEGFIQWKRRIKRYLNSSGIRPEKW